MEMGEGRIHSEERIHAEERSELIANRRTNVATVGIADDENDTDERSRLIANTRTNVATTGIIDDKVPMNNRSMQTITSISYTLLTFLLLFLTVEETYTLMLYVGISYCVFYPLDYYRRFHEHKDYLAHKYLCMIPSVITCITAMYDDVVHKFGSETVWTPVLYLLGLVVSTIALMIAHELVISPSPVLDIVENSSTKSVKEKYIWSLNAMSFCMTLCIIYALVAISMSIDNRDRWGITMPLGWIIVLSVVYLIATWVMYLLDCGMKKRQRFQLAFTITLPVTSLTLLLVDKLEPNTNCFVHIGFIATLVLHFLIMINKLSDEKNIAMENEIYPEDLNV